MSSVLTSPGSLYDVDMLSNTLTRSPAVPPGHVHHLSTLTAGKHEHLSKTFNKVTPLNQEGWSKTLIMGGRGDGRCPILVEKKRAGCRRGLRRNLHIPEFGLYEEKEAKGGNKLLP